VSIRVFRDDENPRLLYDEGHQPPADLATTAQREACRECDATVHFALVNRRWSVAIFHEETCGELARLRADPSPGAGNAYAKQIEARLAEHGFKVGPPSLVEYEVPDSAHAGTIAVADRQN
jgi:hypothetical protein